MPPKPLKFLAYCLNCGEHEVTLPVVGYAETAAYFKTLSWTGDFCSRCERSGVLLFWEQILEVESS